MRRFVLGLLMGGVMAVAGSQFFVAKPRAAQVLQLYPQGHGLTIIKDPYSGACWLMVDRGESASITTAPEKTCS